MMGKFAIVLLTEALIILPIIFGAHFHGHDSYKQYYDTHANDEQKHATAAHKITTESYYNSSKVNYKYASKDSFASSDVRQARVDDGNYVKASGCGDKKQTFCEDVPDYPQELVNRLVAELLARNPDLRPHTDIIPLAPRSETDEELLCLSTERLIRPKTALNLQDEWSYILQTGDFQQALRIEICIEEDTKCRLVDGFAEGYVTMCKQNYIFHELYTVTENGTAIRDFFRIPAACCCHVQFKPEGL